MSLLDGSWIGYFEDGFLISFRNFLLNDLELDVRCRIVFDESQVSCCVNEVFGAQIVRVDEA